jgi:hypothetical protein
VRLWEAEPVTWWFKMYQRMPLIWATAPFQSPEGSSLSVIRLLMGCASIVE